MDIRIESEQEEDGRWLAEVIGLPGVMAYGTSRLQAMAKAEALAFRTLAERLEHNKSLPDGNKPQGAHIVLSQGGMPVSRLVLEDRG